MMRVDEDLSEFYAMCSAHGEPWSRISTGHGRLLRSPTVFEDLVKVILTTNVQWGGTRRMAAELVSQYGAVWYGDPSIRAFPSPAAIAADDFETFRQRVHLGYRAAAVHALARRFAAGDLSEQDFQGDTVPSEELRQRLLSIRGIGPYASASMLMLLGRYDFLPVDTVFIDFMRRRYFNNREFNLPEALAVYADWGRWKYLAYWFEMINS
jgi:3-methyladenine DNA glycosylase/8-oxoguanine DNA glycosylase